MSLFMTFNTLGTASSIPILIFIFIGHDSQVNLALSLKAHTDLLSSYHNNFPVHRLPLDAL